MPSTCRGRLYEAKVCASGMWLLLQCMMLAKAALPRLILWIQYTYAVGTKQEMEILEWKECGEPNGGKGDASPPKPKKRKKVTSVPSVDSSPSPNIGKTTLLLLSLSPSFTIDLILYYFIAKSSSKATAAKCANRVKRVKDKGECT